MSASGSHAFAQLIVQVGAPHLRQPFTYRIPCGMELAIGDCVVAPFGSRELTAYVVGLNDDCAPEILDKTKEISGKIENAAGFDEPLWQLAQWIMAQTLCDAESALRLIAPEVASARMRTILRLIDPSIDIAGLPAGAAQIITALQAARGNTLPVASLGKSPDTARAVAALRKRGIVTRQVSVEPPAARNKTVRLVRLCVDYDVAASEAARLESTRASKQAKLLRELATGAAQSAGAAIPEAGRVVEADMRVAAQALAEKGLVAYHEMAIRRDPFGVRSLSRTTPPPFTDEQAAAARQIGSGIESRQFASYLLFGVTGSGKTEIYMDAIGRARAQGRGAIVLLPEISLSAQVMDILKARFGADVAVLHSALSTGEWFDEWQRIRRGEAMVVVGARSAIFAPLPSLGAIIVDEEHDGAYKQDSSPRYNARDVALYRARQAGGVVILGSATPSIETYYKATTGVHTLLTLEYRVHARPLPPVRTLDLRLAVKSTNDALPAHLRGIISPPLLGAIGDRIVRREQVILFLNRRGFAQFLLCRDCGHSFRCPNCAVSLTYHRDLGILQCHHCDYRLSAPANCPKCNGLALRPFGIGTEKVQEAVCAAFPSARTLRMDRDTVTKRGAHGEILRSFKRGEADVLIGTQMVAKGLDFANVTLVGVINADTALNLPDFRASERSFQLLMQVSGRAGRGETQGAVMVQTFNPDHESVRLASQHDYQAFYDIEIANRRELRYPPFAVLANLVFSDEDEKRVIERAHSAARKVKGVAGKLLASLGPLDPAMPAADRPTIDILGPVACPLERIRNRYRWHILVRCAKKPLLLAVMRRTLAELSPTERTGLTLDIDPITML